MVVTGLSIVSEAMREIGAYSGVEPLKAHEIAVGLTRLNAMLHLWSVDGLMVRANYLESFTLIPGTVSYTIGVGAVFNTVKPYYIVNAFIRDSYNLDTPLYIMGSNEWNDIQNKIISNGRSESLYYNPGITQQTVQTGTIYLNPPPDEDYVLWIESNKALSEIATAATALTFENVYYEAIMYNLAKRLWGVYHDTAIPISQDIKDFARQSKKALETLNSKNVVSRTELPNSSKRWGYNVYTDGYNS